MHLTNIYVMVPGTVPCACDVPMNKKHFLTATPALTDLSTFIPLEIHENQDFSGLLGNEYTSSIWILTFWFSFHLRSSVLLY